LGTSTREATQTDSNIVRKLFARTSSLLLTSRSTWRGGLHDRVPLAENGLNLASIDPAVVSYLR